LLAALAACTTVGPDYNVPEEAVVKRDAANAPFMGAAEPPFKSEPLPADWWRLYQDPVLDKLVAKALSANADLRVAAANLARTHAVLGKSRRRSVRKSRSAPRLAVRPHRRRLKSACPSAARTGIYEPARQGRLSGRYVGPHPPRHGSRRMPTRKPRRRADLVHVMVAADTTRAYAEACSAGYQLKVAQQSVDLQQKFVKLTDRARARGRGIAIDTQPCPQPARRSCAPTLPPLMARHRTALYRLAVLTGEVPSAFPAEVRSARRRRACRGDPGRRRRRPAAPPSRRAPGRTPAGRRHRAHRRRHRRAVPEHQLGACSAAVGFMDQFGEANTWKFSLGPLISWNLAGDQLGARAHRPGRGGHRRRAGAFRLGVVLNALRETESALTVYARELDRNAMLRAARDQSALASARPSCTSSAAPTSWRGAGCGPHAGRYRIGPISVKSRLMMLAQWPGVRRSTPPAANSGADATSIAGALCASVDHFAVLPEIALRPWRLGRPPRRAPARLR
jgi:hypothetical protein